MVSGALRAQGQSANHISITAQDVFPPAIVMDGGNATMSFVDTTGWLGSGDLTDSVHPNDRGHRVIADRLAPIIAARVGG